VINNLRIFQARGHAVVLDSDLALLYGVTTKRFNEQFRRNRNRFPADFAFQLSQQEFDSLRSQFATLKAGRGRHAKYLPYAFTEHGALMAANVLNSRRAIEASVFVVRAFVRLREVLATHKHLARKLEELERKAEALAAKHDALATSTHAQFKEVIEALRALMNPPAPRTRPIGFVTPPEKKSGGTARAGETRGMRGEISVG
jgi:phage regulator Rha-like protein